MRIPRRPLNSIPSVALPSIHTTFPAEYLKREISKTYTADTSATPYEDGIELVPIERQNGSYAKILSPGTEEKEVIPNSGTALSTKPLPRIPQSRWSRLSSKQKTWLVVSSLAVVALTVGLSLLATKGESSKKSNEATNAQSIDPSNLSPMPDFPSIKRGTFVVPLGNVQQQSSACLAKSNESLAWGCTSDQLIQLNVLPSSSDQSTLTIVSLGPLSGSNSGVLGQQPYSIEPVELEQLMSPSNLANGPAYYFHTSYNRTVILREEALGPQGEIRVPTTDSSTKMEPGDSVWQCDFNETQLEGFIYVDQKSSSANKTLKTSIGNDTQAAELPYFPYVLKITEQRTRNSTQPYCQKMNVTSDGTLIRESALIMLSLVDDGSVRQIPRANTNMTVSKMQPMPLANSCRCQWMIQ